MKTVGTTNDGGRLVSLNEDEYFEFCRLVAAVRGESLSDIQSLGFRNLELEDRRNPSVEIDFKDVFGHIRAFSLASFRINELQHVVDQFKSVMEAGQ